MRQILSLLAVFLLPTICGAQTDYFPDDKWDDSDFPPVLLNNPDRIIYLKDTIEIPEIRTRGYGKLFIDKQGNIDSVICAAPVYKSEKLEAFCKQAEFRGGIWSNRFLNMELEFYLWFLDFHPTTKARIEFIDFAGIQNVNGERIVQSVFDEHNYNIAYRNAIFNRDFPKSLDQVIGYIDFNILVDTIRSINRSGEYHIPDREGYSLKIQNQGGDEHFLLINVRRNRQIILTNALVMNLEKEDDYLLLCQKYNRYDSQFYIEEFTLTGDKVVKPEYQKITNKELRDRITTKWGRRWASSH